MSTLQGLKNLFAYEAAPSPFAVAEELACYLEARGNYQDDLAVINILEQKGYKGPFGRAAHIISPLMGQTSSEKMASARIENIQIYLKLGQAARPEDIKALKMR